MAVDCKHKGLRAQPATGKAGEHEHIMNMADHMDPSLS